MKKFCFLFSILFLGLFTLFFPQITRAAWQKFPENPVIQPGNPGSWDAQGRLLPHVIFEEGIYKMWFTGTNGITSQIGYAFSNDGISWEFSLENPIIKPNFENINLADPFVIHENGIYRMWLTVQPPSGSLIVKTTTSIDGISWNPLTTIIADQLWESPNVMVQPTVIKNNNGYLLWYDAVKYSGWKIGFASSSDGITWQKNSSPVLYPEKPWEGSDIGGSKVIYYNNHFEIFYHAGNPDVIGHALSTDGINWTKPDDNPLLVKGPGNFDSNRMISPSVVISPDNSKMLMFYGGYNGSFYSIGLATQLLTPIPSLKPIVLIPGMFASWNNQAILENANIPQSEWKMTPFVNIYDGLIETLKKAGYSNDSNDPKQNLFVFNYDWRKLVNSSTSDLDTYIKNKVLTKNPNAKINIIGHSLGGLIGRTYMQNYPTNPVDQLITLGTPHSGTVQAYKAWEGGVNENKNPLEKLAYEIILGLNRKGFTTNKDLIREIAPVTSNLLPTFDYLLTSENKIINAQQMNQKNNWLNDLETNFPQLFYKFYSIYGETGQTPEWYKVQKPNLLENLLGLWQDGKPTETLTTVFGDETVLSKSATRSADAAYLLNGVNHRNLITDKNSLIEIMNYLNLKPTEIITPPPFPEIFPSIFVAIKSPAKFTVINSGNIYKSNEDGYVFIPNAQNSLYQIQVEGTDTGIYHLEIGALSENKSVWKEIINQTSQGKTDNYSFSFNFQNLSDDSLIDNDGIIHLNLALEEARELKNKYPHWINTLTFRAIENIIKLYEKGKYKDSLNQIKITYQNLSLFRRKTSNTQSFNSTISIIENLMYAQEKIFLKSKNQINPQQLKAEISALTLMKEVINQKLKITGNEKSAQLFIIAQKLLDKANSDFNNGNFYKSESELMNVGFIFSEI